MHHARSTGRAHSTAVQAEEALSLLGKVASGIPGLDQILGGGLPVGRATLVAGDTGTGKTLLGLEFLVHGALRYGEPGLFVAFEETAHELGANVASFGIDLEGLVAADLLRVDEVQFDRLDMNPVGAYDLEGLFIRMGHAIDAIGAKRVVLDTVDVLFSGMPEPGLVRAELMRLVRWLKEKGVTTVITAEHGRSGLTRHGIEEFVADCVIVLDHRVEHELSVRRLRIVKYRGSGHGTDEYPFLIDEDGIWVNPVSGVTLQYEASTERVSTGIADLDAMLGGGGVYRGSSVLLSGTAGTGKTSISASFIDAACRRGERGVFFSFEESADQIIRDLRSIGLDLRPWVDAGLLHFRSVRPTAHGLEQHLSRMFRLIERVDPSVVVVDPITTFSAIASDRNVASAISRLMDRCRTEGITSVFASLNVGGSPLESTDAHVSSVADVWVVVRDIESNGERNRALYVLKARGLAHSNQVREFVFRDDGIALLPVHVDADGVKIGSARLTQEARERLAEEARRQIMERTRRDLELHRERRVASLAAMDADFALEEARLQTALDQAAEADARHAEDRRSLAARRGGGRPTAAADEEPA